MIDLSHISKLPDEALVSIQTLAALTEQGISTVWRKLSTDPDYPEVVHLGTRCTRVRLGEVRKLIANKMAIATQAQSAA